MTQQFLVGCLFFWDFNSETTAVNNINYLNVMKIFQSQIIVPAYQDNNHNKYIFWCGSVWQLENPIYTK